MRSVDIWKLGYREKIQGQARTEDSHVKREREAAKQGEVSQNPDWQGRQPPNGQESHLFLLTAREIMLLDPNKPIEYIFLKVRPIHTLLWN